MIDCEFDTLILSLVLIWIFYVFNFNLQLSKVNISTPKNKADYNKMYNEIQLIISSIIASFKVVVELYKLSGFNESDFNWLLNNDLYQKVYK